jgi:hypothetical protein
MFKVVLSLALIGASSAQLSCEDCSMIGNTLSGIMNTEENIQAQVDFLVGPVCENAPQELDCMNNFPRLWPYISAVIFDPAQGWFAPANLCSDVCMKKSFLKNPSCDDCELRLYGSISFMADEEIQVQVVSDFINNGFCDQFEGDDVGLCMGGIELALPTAMTVLSTTGDLWIKDFCGNDIMCN